MRESELVTKHSKIIYLAPAILCCVAILCGAIPCVFCLNEMPFAWASFFVFAVSIFLHAYILYEWKRYANHSPFAYAIVQPCNHLIIMCIALAVGSTNLCSVPSSGLGETTFEYFEFQPKF
jgi:hypothetical protein